MEEKQFDLTVTAQRTLDDFARAWQRDDSLCRISPPLILVAQDFQWWALTTRHLTLRVEAIRAAPERRDDGLWDWPQAFRIVRVQDGQRTEQVLARRLLFEATAGGLDPRTDWLAWLSSPDFIGLQYAVGRRIVTIKPEAEPRARLEATEIIEANHVAEAIQYRPRWW